MLRDLVMLIGFAAVFAYALDPAVSWLEHRAWGRARRLPRAVAAGLTIVLLGTLVAAVVAEAVPRLVQQFVRFAAAAPGTFAHLQQDLRAFLGSHGFGGAASGSETGASAGSSIFGAVESGLRSVLGSVLGGLRGLGTLVLLPLFAFYMLADARQARAVVLALVPSSRVERGERLLNALDRALRAYVRGQALVCLAMGATMAVVLLLLGFPVA